MEKKAKERPLRKSYLEVIGVREDQEDSRELREVRKYSILEDHSKPEPLVSPCGWHKRVAK